MNIKIINAAVPAGNLINNINNYIKKTNDNINIIIIPVSLISSDNGLSFGLILLIKFLKFNIIILFL